MSDEPVVTRPQMSVLGEDALVPGPCTPVTVTAGDGASITARAHGGHVTHWTPAGGTERLWLSPATGCGPGTAIRGGVPVIFPQFAGRGPLPKHGFARDRGWRLTPGADGGPVAELSAELTADEGTRAIWPHTFTLRLTARAAGPWLELTLAARNDGTQAFAFTAALHGYLRVGDVAATVEGLGGLPAEDNAAGGAALTTPAGPLEALEPRDIAVRGATAPVTLADPVLGRLVLTAEGFGDRVMWNPGPGHGLADVPEGGERGFVCVEPAALEPVTLAPGEEWRGTQRLEA